MKTYDIKSDSRGWLCLEDGVEASVFATLDLAMAALQAQVGEDRRSGLVSQIRCQEVDGSMRPVAARRSAAETVIAFPATPVIERSGPVAWQMRG